MKKVRNGRGGLWAAFLWLALVPAAQGFYDPTVQRWISRDPIGESADANLYRFVANDADNQFDPDGRDVVSGKVWGNYCGSGWCGGKKQDENNGGSSAGVEATDEMDACCKTHDACLGGWDPSTGKPKPREDHKVCDPPMCTCLSAIDICEFIKDHNVDPVAAAKAYNLMLGWFCGLAPTDESLGLTTGGIVLLCA